MKKYTSIFLLLLAVTFSAQQANRFFYELTFKPKKSSDLREKVMTVLDITDGKSVYQDFTVMAQDSIMKVEMEAMKKAGVWKDMSKSMNMPKFSYKIQKSYPDMKITYKDRISLKLFSYPDEAAMNWKIYPEKMKIGDYDAQKATADFGGRKWTAWFSSEIPFTDGPYKFSGLPGLIVKVEDAEQHYSWTLKGNKKVADWDENSYAEKTFSGMGMNSTPIETTKEKFQKSFDNYKADPLAEMRPYMTPELMNRTMPGSSKTIGETVREQEKMLKDFFDANDNPIER